MASFLARAGLRSCAGRISLPPRTVLVAAPAPAAAPAAAAASGTTAAAAAARRGLALRAAVPASPISSVPVPALMACPATRAASAVGFHTAAPAHATSTANMTADFAAEYEHLEPYLTFGQRGSAKSLHRLIAACGSTKDFNFVVEVLQTYRRDDMKISRFASDQFVEKAIDLDLADAALRVLSNKVLYGVFPERRGFNRLMHHFFDAEDYEAVVEVFEQQVMQGCPNSAPSGRSYELLFAACASSRGRGLKKKAITYYHAGSKDGTTMTAAGLLAVADMCSQLGHAAEAASAVEAFQAKFTPNADPEHVTSHLSWSLVKSLASAPASEVLKKLEAHHAAASAAADSAQEGTDSTDKDETDGDDAADEPKKPE